MPSLIERLVGKLKGDPSGADRMPPNEGDGTRNEAAAAGWPSETEVFGSLSDADIDHRIEAATRRLGDLEAFDDPRDIPMVELSDRELEARLARIEAEMVTLAGSAASVEEAPLSSSADMARHLEVIDYLLDHPDATLPPLWALRDHPALWPDDLAQNACERQVTRDDA